MKAKATFSTAHGVRLVTTLLLMLLTASTAWAFKTAATAVSYIDENGNTQNCTNYTVITSSTGTTWSEGWYVVNSTVEIGSRVSVSGHVRLILVDGCSLSIGSGIEVNDPNSITIYGQSANSGRLNCGAPNYCAAIGGNKYQGNNDPSSRSYGDITINGGTIEVTGGYWAAGIGAGSAKDRDYRLGGTITINGGNITANGGRASAGIGGGYCSSTGTITINAGNINASAGVASDDLFATGIGGGIYNEWWLSQSNAGTVNINGGRITTTTYEYGMYGCRPGVGTGTSGKYITINLNWTRASDRYAFSVPRITSNEMMYDGCYGYKNYLKTFEKGWENNRQILVPHKGYTFHAKKDATCTENGYSRNCYQCPECGKYFTDNTVPTECDKSEVYLEPLGHDMEYTAAVPATFTSNGHIAYYHCKRCNKYFKDSAGRFEITLAETVTTAVTYLDENGVEQTLASGTSVTADNAVWSNGWYIVDHDVTFDARVSVNGTVNLLLLDGKTLTVKNGIEVKRWNTFRIYAQSTDENTMGKLVASLDEDDDDSEDCSTIGGSKSFHQKGTTTVNGIAGTIVINGGNLDVTSRGCYAIGDGEVEYEVNDDEREYFQTTTFNLTINGGIIYLGRGNYDGLYNGSIGSQADDATITINGGKITTSNGINCRYKGHLSINDTGRPLELRTSINAFHGGSITLSGQFMLNDGTGTEAVANHVDGWYYTTNFENKTIVNYRSVTLNDFEASATEKIPFGTAVDEPSRSSHPGYTFVGWANDNALYDFSAPVTADMTITAKYRDLTHFGYTSSYTPDGSENNPYIISTIDGWNAFCDALQDNFVWNRFIGQDVQMSNNIGSAQQPVIRMAGSTDHEFCGNFDGGSHTLTFTATAADNYCAPFRNVRGGSTADDAITISNLNVKTTITATDYRHTAGLIALQSGHVNVTDCNATVDISSTKGSNNTDLYPAGLVSQASSDNGGTLRIEHCTASGRIATNGKYAGGLVGIVQGSTTITDCLSSVTISSSTSGDGTHGGIVGVTASKSGLEIYGCVFNGSLLGANTECVGGFVGWRQSGANIYNSLFIPTEVTVKNTNSATFARNLIDTYNCYYTYLLNDGTNYKPVYVGGDKTPNLWRNGKAPRTVEAGENVTITDIALIGTTTPYGVAGITAYSGGGISYGDMLYYGSGDQVSLTLSHPAPTAGYTCNGYTATAGTLAGNDDDGYTLTMPDDDVSISTDFSIDDWAVGHAGTEDDPYMIYYKEQLDLLASRVNQGNRYRYDEDNPVGYYFKLGADIAYDPDELTIDNDGDGINDSNYTPIGAYVNYAWLDFGGTFDGDGHTISGIRVYMTDGIGQYQGLFGHVYGGTIKNVTLADAQITGQYYNGGIAGYTDNESTITNCRVVNVAIHANDEYAENFGGITGVNHGTLSNNLVIGATIPAAADNSCGAICGRIEAEYNGSFLQHNYYTACTVAGVENAAGVGCGIYDINNDSIRIEDIDHYDFYYDADYYDAAVPALRNNAANATAIGLFATLPANVDFGWGEGKYPVQLTGRTLWKDGDWNTLCLPFSLSAEQVATMLDNPTALMTLNGTTSDLTDGTLTLNFTDATSISAGVPYIIKWDSGDNLVSPVFTGVTIDKTMHDVKTSDGNITFKGSYDYQQFTTEDQSILFLGADNTLYWPQNGARIGACRAYFQVSDDVTAGDPSNPNAIRAFNLNFDSNVTTGIVEMRNEEGEMRNGNEGMRNDGAWYTLDGRKLDGQPTVKGLYIHNGRKILIK
ncbi:MAG: hypothetical protein IKZ48_04870 [Prevotella sp.]|nr:hypothetical protein [Prevotella sp.]